MRTHSEFNGALTVQPFVSPPFSYHGPLLYELNVNISILGALFNFFSLIQVSLAWFKEVLGLPRKELFFEKIFSKTYEQN